MKRAFLLGIIAAMTVSCTHAFDLGWQGANFGRLGASSKKGTLAPPPTCLATNGQVDLSFCSNAVYAALIF